jgi:hypothetical protein
MEKAKRERFKAQPRPDVELHSLPDHAFLTEAEAAQLLRMSRIAMTMRRQRGLPPRHVKIGRLIRYRVGELRHIGDTA